MKNKLRLSGYFIKLTIVFLLLSFLLSCAGPIPSKPTINSFTATPDVIVPGGNSTLSWDVSGATSVTINQGIGDVEVSSGTRSVTPSTTTIYTLKATNSAGSVVAITSVTVTSGSRPTINSFTAEPPTIASGDSSTLSWTITDATSVTISHGIGSVSSTGTRSVSPTTTTNYLLTATNSAGSVFATATVTIAPKPTINFFKANPPTIASGDSSTLSWTITDATSVTISHGIGSVSSIDARSVRPTRTTTYTLTATNSVGSVTATATVTIAPKPTINSFTATPEVIDSGGSSVLSWNVTNATSVKIEPGIGSVSAVGTRSVSPTTTTTYTLTATNSVGSVTAKVRVRVNETKIIQPGPIDGQDVEVCRYLPDTSMGGDSSVLFVGRGWWVSPLDVNRTYIKFNLSSIPTGAVIIDAKLKLYQDNYTGESGYPNMEIFLWRAEDGWNENTITWNNQPPTSRVALGGSWIIDHVSNQWRERDITVLVSGWFRGIYPNYGLMLSAKNEFTIKALAMFCSSNNTDALKRPKLEIKYYIP